MMVPTDPIRYSHCDQCGRVRPNGDHPHLDGRNLLGCKCEQCWSLREYLEAHDMDTHGLTPAPGHQGLEVVKESSSMTELNGAELARLQHMARKRQSQRQPWDVAA